MGEDLSPRKQQLGGGSAQQQLAGTPNKKSGNLADDGTPSPGAPRAVVGATAASGETVLEKKKT
jgi:hypothetical protein